MSSAPKLLTLPAKARRLAAASVRRARCARGLTQAEAAALVGLSERSYRDIELGRVRMAALEALIVLEASASGGSHGPALVKAGTVSRDAAGHDTSHLEHIAAAPEPATIRTALGICVDGQATDSTGSGICNGHPDTSALAHRTANSELVPGTAENPGTSRPRAEQRGPSRGPAGAAKSTAARTTHGSEEPAPSRRAA